MTSGPNSSRTAPARFGPRSVLGWMHHPPQFVDNQQLGIVDQDPCR